MAAHDRSIFTTADAAERMEARYPPYVRLSNVLAWGPDEAAARACIEDVAAELRRGFGLPADALAGPGCEQPDPIRQPVVLGPARCVIERAKDRYRFHLLIKSPLDGDVSEAIRAALERAGTRPGVHVAVDVDAYDLM